MKTLTIILGPPCGGKSTLALRIGAPRFSVRHWFEPLRSTLALPPTGTFLDNELIFAAVRSFLAEHEAAERIVFDGFPGNATQLNWVMSELSMKRRISFRFIHVDRGTAMRRALARRVCLHCDGGADPIIPTANGRCPVCGSTLGRRSDDTEEHFQERWQNYFIRAQEMCRQFDQFRAAVEDAHDVLLQEGLRMDLHLHTTASDGTYSQAELMERVATEGIGLCSVTDHDTVSGIDEARECARQMGIAFLPGIEVSALWQGHLIHLLGYGIDSENSRLRSAIESNREAHREYDDRVLRILVSRGLLPPDSGERYVGYEWNRRRGGWKLLNFLTDVGLCQDGADYLRLMNEMNAGETEYLPAEKAIGAIRDSGLCVLAHPGAYGWSPEVLPTHLECLRDLGLDGLECHHPQNDPILTEYLLVCCARWSLLPTGGSDEHGNLPDRALGSPRVDTRMLGTHTVTSRIIWPDTYNDTVGGMNHEKGHFIGN